MLYSYINVLDHLVGTLKPQSNGPLDSNAVIGIGPQWPLTGGLLHLVQRKEGTRRGFITQLNSTSS